MNKYIYPNLSYNLIQEIRFAQALMESDFNICIPKNHHYKFSYLQKFYPIKFFTPNSKSITINELEINHKTPRTKIGLIEKPLLFPKAMVNYCYKLWNKKRNLKLTFIGLLTKKRKETLSQFCQKTSPFQHTIIPSDLSFIHSLIDKIKERMGFYGYITHHHGDIYIFHTSRGRNFPIKCWDNSYYKLMGKSKFVLCPNGDYIWTYRFFESILCGAIPIVEQSCDVYDGFYYRRMDEQLDDLAWISKYADHNFQLCSERITVLTKILNKEIERLYSQVINQNNTK